jgi:hypothetical protein
VLNLQLGDGVPFDVRFFDSSWQAVLLDLPMTLADVDFSDTAAAGVNKQHKV